MAEEHQLDFMDLMADSLKEDHQRAAARLDAGSTDPGQMGIAEPGGLIGLGQSLKARPVYPHSLVKARRIGNYAQAVVTALGSRFEIWWLELFAGPGLLWDRAKGEATDGSSLQAMKMTGQLGGLILSDFDLQCVASLDEVAGPFRGGQRQIHVLQGDANNEAHFDRIVALIPAHALVLAYLDPEGLDLHWATIQRLAWRFKRLDLLLNLPVPAIDRCLSAGTEPNLARVRHVLGHPNPEELRRGAVTREAIRDWVRGQLRELGYQAPTGHEIPSMSKNVPQYDLLIASRDPLGAQLYERVNRNAPGGQRGLELAG